MATAGRTVLFSAMTVALSMAAMVLFPMYFLKSFAYAGVATVAFAALAAIVVTPAAIVLLGDRLDSLDVRRLVRRVLRRPEPVRKPVEQLFWYRSTKFVMRRAVPIGLAVVALLLLLGAPFLGVKWGFPDDRVLPQSASAHQVGDQLRNDFADNSATAVTVVVPDADGLTPADLERYAADLSRVPDVSAVSAPTGTFVGGHAGRTARRADRDGRRQRVPDRRQHGAAVLRQPRRPNSTGCTRCPAPAAGTVEMTGVAQINRDSVDAITSRLPLVLGADRRDHLRAAVPAHRQRGAAAEGAGAQRAFADRRVRRAGVDLPGRPPGCARHHADRNAGRATCRCCCSASRSGCRWTTRCSWFPGSASSGCASGRTRADNDESVALGVARTGRVITAAALVMSISFAALIAAHVSVHADVRARPDAGRAGRRHAGADGAGAGVHAPAGAVELVGAEAAGAAARPRRSARG